MQYEELEPMIIQMVRWTCPEPGCETQIEGDLAGVEFQVEMHISGHEVGD